MRVTCVKRSPSSSPSKAGWRSASPAQMAQACDVIITVVVNAEQTETVLFGEGGAVASLRAASLVIGCATVAPTYAVELGQRLGEHGLLYLDAPISGGAAKAAAGEMTMMTSGPQAAYAKAEAVLAGMAGKVYRLGDVHGLGSKVKIINQLLAGVHIAASAEAMALGLREGVDADALYEVITHSAGNSWMFENRVPHILKADYTPLSAVDIFVKDLGLVLDTARASKFPLPLSAHGAPNVHAGVQRRFRPRGRLGGDQDFPGYRPAHRQARACLRNAA